MRPHRRTVIERDQDYRDIAKLLRLDYSIQEIADKIGRSKEVVFRDAKELRASWRSQNMTDLAAWRERQLQQIAVAKREAWVAWEASKAGRTKEVRDSRTTEGGGNGEGGKSARAMIEKETSPGDPRYLSIYNQLLAREAALLGLDMPTDTPLAAEALMRPIDAPAVAPASSPELEQELPRISNGRLKPLQIAEASKSGEIIDVDAFAPRGEDPNARPDA